MRRQGTAQLDLPLLAGRDPEPAPVVARPAHACRGCGWLREGLAACPACGAADLNPGPTPDPTPGPTPGPRLPPLRRPRPEPR